MAIVGPTGTGKSRLAVDLADQFRGEIVNADSRQVYREMDIGTAKPSLSDRRTVPHHLFDIVAPDGSFSLAEYQILANRKIREIQNTGSIPILVGGSGQYVWSILEGWEIPQVPPDSGLREALEREAAAKGIEVLFQRLCQLDWVAAQRIDKRNVRRIIRALEVAGSGIVGSGRSRSKKLPGYRILVIGLTLSRKDLYRRVDDRVEAMIEHGLIDETRILLEKGYNLELPALSSIGYRQAGLLLQGRIKQSEMTLQMKTETHRFIRHQYAWFRLGDARIRWFDVHSCVKPEIMTLISDFCN